MNAARTDAIRWQRLLLSLCAPLVLLTIMAAYCSGTFATIGVDFGSTRGVPYHVPIRIARSGPVWNSATEYTGVQE